MKLNSPEFWDNKIEENFFLINKSPVYRDKISYIVQSLKESNGSLLDVGVGYGHLENVIEKKNINLNLSGIDISKTSINILKKRHKGDFLRAPITRIPFPKNSYDVVLALDILEHLSVKTCLSGLKEIYRVMKNDGKFIISVPINENDIDSITNHHLQKYDLNTIKEQVDKTGFIIDKKHYLVAYKNNYLIKKMINKYLAISKPNLLILICKKK